MSEKEAGGERPHTAITQDGGVGDPIPSSVQILRFLKTEFFPDFFSLTFPTFPTFQCVTFLLRWPKATSPPQELERSGPLGHVPF